MLLKKKNLFPLSYSASRENQAIRTLNLLYQLTQIVIDFRIKYKYIHCEDRRTFRGKKGKKPNPKTSFLP